MIIPSILIIILIILVDLILIDTVIATINIAMVIVFFPQAVLPQERRGAETRIDALRELVARQQSREQVLQDSHKEL